VLTALFILTSIIGIYNIILFYLHKKLYHTFAMDNLSLIKCFLHGRKLHELSYQT